MFLYLLLSTAIITSPELSTNNAPENQESTTHAINEQQELEKIIALFTQDGTTEESSAVATAAITKTDSPATTCSTTTPISICNTITPDMLAYKHWTGTYSPEKFTVKVNGIEIAQGASCTIEKPDSNLEISYTYSFMNGMRTGEKTVAYKLHENSTQANITFSWKNDWKVLVDNGVAIKEVTT